VRSSGGVLGLDRDKLPPGSLLHGLPGGISTPQWAGGLGGDQGGFKSRGLKIASVIPSGTDPRFREHQNHNPPDHAAATSLRGRVGDIDQYNVKSTTNVNFDTGMSTLSAQAKNDLCAAATSAESLDNALLLVVGYTDSTGSDEINQELSEKRATRVVNYLQQA